MTDPINQKTTEELAKENDLSRSQERIQQLSEKVELTSRERDEKDNIVKERDVKIAELERENAFNSGFVDILGNHPAAKDHKDEIKAKVLAGYSAEDAALAVLAKAGKLGASVAPMVAPQVAGGSASTVIASNGEKSITDMSTAEKREALAKVLAIG